VGIISMEDVSKSLLKDRQLRIDQLQHLTLTKAKVIVSVIYP
jgi:hypothetical protein